MIEKYVNMMAIMSSRVRNITDFLLKENKKVILFLLVIFLLMRVGTALFLGHQDIEGLDSVHYNQYASAILKNSHWVTSAEFAGNFRAPGYPLFIAAIYSIFGSNNYLAVFIFQALLSVLTCFFIYKLSRKMFDETVAFLSFIWSGFYIFYFYYMRFLLREPLVFFLMIAFFYYFYLYITDEEKRSKNFWLFSILYIFLIHTDARYLFYLPFFFFLFVLYKPVMQGVKQYFVFLVVFILLLVPWTVRNYLTYDGFVLINTRTLDLRPKDTRSPKPFSRISDHILNFKTTTETKRSVYPTEEERELIKQGLNPKGRPEDEIAAIKDDVYPASGFLKRKMFWLIELWRPVRFSSYYSPFPDAKFHHKWSLMHNLSSMLCYGILLPFLLIGMYFMLKKRHRAFIFLLFPVFLQTMLHVLHCGIWRYRVPIDAFIIMIAFYGTAQTFKYLINKSRNGLSPRT